MIIGRLLKASQKSRLAAIIDKTLGGLYFIKSWHLQDTVLKAILNDKHIEKY